MKPALNERRLCGAVFAAALFMYLSARSLYFNFDGVACAIAVELSDFKHLVHGNHLAYGVVAWLFDASWRALGYKGPALLVLQVLDALLGAAGAAAFASLLARSGRTAREAALGAGALAVSSAWWFWSLEAQVYMLGALFAALAAREALADAPRPKLAGLWLAAAALGHVGHLTALPALAWMLSRKDRRSVVPFFAVAASVLAVSYAAAGVFAVRPHAFGELRLWLLGSAALGVDRSFAWHSTSLAEALPAWTKMTFRVFCDFSGRPTLPKIAGFLLAALPLAAAAVGAVKGGVRARFWLLWLAGYALLFINWEPFTVVYRVGDLLGLWFLALLGLDSLSPRARALGLAAWIAAAGAYNYRGSILPASDPANNPDLVETRWVQARVPPDAWVLTYGRGAVYLPYFAGLKTVNLRYLEDPAALYARLDALAASGAALYATDRSVEHADLLVPLAAYGLETVSTADGFTLYRIRRSAAAPKKKGPKGR